jgi:16S rRNA (cytosine1402-N4)-methyltransferase
LSDASNPAGEGERPPRRKRYSGKYPRRFAEKYKEHDPQRFAETVAKVIASGKTPAGSHVPILVEEAMAALGLGPGKAGVDATLGHGGHALQILERISPGGFLLGLDVDPLEQARALARLRTAGVGEDAFVAIRSNYAGIRKALDRVSRDGVDFVLADLGCSSMQYDDPERGFSFKAEGPLDMRMNPQRGLPAREWIIRTASGELTDILRENADEPRAERLAERLASRDFPTTLALAKAVRAAVPELEETTAELTVRRVFQAIRIAVNDEFGSLDAFLRSLPDCLKPGGRAVILSFHSGEDRRVKKAFQSGLRDSVYSSISEGVTTAGMEERRMNPRSSAAKLRWAEKGPLQDAREKA